MLDKRFSIFVTLSFSCVNAQMCQLVLCCSGIFLSTANNYIFSHDLKCPGNIIQLKCINVKQVLRNVCITTFFYVLQLIVFQKQRLVLQLTFILSPSSTFRAKIIFAYIPVPCITRSQRYGLQIPLVLISL